MCGSAKQLRAVMLTFISLLVVKTPVSAQTRVVEVFCEDRLGECHEILRPNPIQIEIGEQVAWSITDSCSLRPCSGLCRILVPPGEGFEGFQAEVQAPGRSEPTPPFLAPGVFLYRLECSPILIGSIIVGDPDQIQLSASGNCPGQMTLSASGAVPNNRVHFAYSLSSGSTPVPNCPGLSVDLNNPVVAGSDIADAGGNASLSGFAPAVACGRLRLQAVDATACDKSNTILLP